MTQAIVPGVFLKHIERTHPHAAVRAQATNLIRGSESMAATYNQRSTAGRPSYCAECAGSTAPKIAVFTLDNNPRAALPGRHLSTLPVNPTTGLIDSLGIDPAVREFHNTAVRVHRFYLDVFGRNSYDGRGAPILGSVHAGVDFFNAFWNGRLMVFGDGSGLSDDSRQNRLTLDSDILAHELTHAVVQTAVPPQGLVYQKESGALNEHFADVFGVMYKQWERQQTDISVMDDKFWLIGDKVIRDLIGNDGTVKQAMRSFQAPGQASQHDLQSLGCLQNGKPHVSAMHANAANEYVQQDQGGVHIFSGIPNYVFYKVCEGLHEPSWTRVGHVWYQTLVNTRNPNMTFQEFAHALIATSSRLGFQDLTNKLITAWREVGIEVSQPYAQPYPTSPNYPVAPTQIPSTSQPYPTSPNYPVAPTPIRPIPQSYAQPYPTSPNYTIAPTPIPPTSQTNTPRFQYPTLSTYPSTTAFRSLSSSSTTEPTLPSALFYV